MLLEVVSFRKMQRETTMDIRDGTKSDPIVIVGMACRQPGDVDGASSLRKLLGVQRSGQCEDPVSAMYPNLGPISRLSTSQKGPRCLVA